VITQVEPLVNHHVIKKNIAAFHGVCVLLQIRISDRIAFRYITYRSKLYQQLNFPSLRQVLSEIRKRLNMSNAFPSSRPRILVTGASGQLGHYILRQLEGCGKSAQGWSGRTCGTIFGANVTPLDFQHPSAILKALNKARPEVIIHAGAMSAADDVRKEPIRGRMINTDATRVIAEWAGAHAARLIYTSTDLVFDGTKSLWQENDPVCPILAYGRTKAAAEPFVTALPLGLVTRISLLYGPTLTGRPSFYTSTLAALAEGQSCTVFIDEWRTPVDYQTTAEILCALAVDQPEISGILHIGGRERITRFELVQRGAVATGLDTSLMIPIKAQELNLPEPRPADVSLDTTRLQSLGLI
jgi:dTDP-4-dehydrorhamnose reductase